MDDSAALQSAPVHVRSALSAHRVVIALSAIVGLFAGAALASTLPVSWSATASVLVQPLDGNPYAPNAQGSDLTNLETEAQVVTSDAIASDVRDELIKQGLPTTSRKGLKVAVAPNTQIIEITYSGDNADIVKATAKQYADSYLAFRTARRDEFIRSKQAATAERVNALTNELKRLGNKGQDPDEPEVRSIGAQLTTLRLQLAGLDTADSNPGEVIATPQAVRSGLSVSWQLGALVGLFLGLAGGAIAALILERRAPVLRTIDDVEHLGVAVLGSHHELDGEETGPQSDPDEKPYDAASLAAIILSRSSEVPTSLAVSNLTGEGSVAPFINDLADVLVRGRGSVLVIDAASETPTRLAGFSEVLAGTSELKSALVKRVRGRPVDPVARMGIGKDPNKGSALYATSRMTEALEAATNEYDYVLLESPGSELTTGRAVVGACHYWIPIVELGKCSRLELERCLEWAAATGVETLGVVVVYSPMDIFGRAKPRELDPVGSG